MCIRDRYSPETAKQYEKSVSRKSNSKFHPKAVLQKLKSNVSVSNEISLTEEEKRQLIAEYLEVKHSPEVGNEHAPES